LLIYNCFIIVDLYFEKEKNLFSYAGLIING